MSTKIERGELLKWLSRSWSLHGVSLSEWKIQQQAYQQIVALIKKQPVEEHGGLKKLQEEKTEEWIEEKARELGEMTKHSDGQGVVYRKDISTCKDFVRSLVEETHGRK